MARRSERHDGDELVAPSLVRRPTTGQSNTAGCSFSARSDFLDEDLLTPRLARYKAPKVFVFVDAVARLENGKPDYHWARQQAITPGVARTPS